MFSQTSVSYAVQRRMGWVITPPPHGGTHPLRIHGPGTLRETVEKQAVRILLECILVYCVSDSHGSRMLVLVSTEPEAKSDCISQWDHLNHILIDADWSTQ